jgi:hypothetical protein
VIDLVDVIGRFLVEDDVADGLALGDVLEEGRRPPTPAVPV